MPPLWHLKTPRAQICDYVQPCASVILNKKYRSKYVLISNKLLRFSYTKVLMNSPIWFGTKSLGWFILQCVWVYVCACKCARIYTEEYNESTEPIDAVNILPLARFEPMTWTTPPSTTPDIDATNCATETSPKRMFK